MIYPALLKAGFERLPPSLRAFHSAPGRRCATGAGTVQRDNALLAWLIGFPPAGDHVPIRLEVDATADEEIWTRRFGPAILRSRQRLWGGLLLESAGPVEVAFELRASAEGLDFQSRRARFWGIPIPLRIVAFARGGEDCWEFEVRIAHVGSYRGRMALKS